MSTMTNHADAPLWSADIAAMRERLAVANLGRFLRGFGEAVLRSRVVAPRPCTACGVLLTFQQVSGVWQPVELHTHRLHWSACPKAHAFRRRERVKAQTLSLFPACPTCGVSGCGVHP